MTNRLFIVLALAAAVGGCGHATRRAPALTEAPPAAPEPPRRDLLREAGDTTWRVVTAPARLVTPAPKPRRVQAAEPSEPPSAVIVRRTYDDEPASATQPAR
jgi:hypothetical protein